MMIKEKSIYKISRNKLLNFLLKVLKDTSHVTHDIHIKNEKCLGIIDDIILKGHESVYFSQDAPDDNIIDDWEYCKNKLYELGSIIQENNYSIGRVTDDLNMNKFLIDCNMEEDICEL